MRQGVLCWVGGALRSLLLGVAAHAAPITYTFTKIADTSGPFSGFGRTGQSINDNGTVAFRASLDAGGEGILATPLVRRTIPRREVWPPFSLANAIPRDWLRGDFVDVFPYKVFGSDEVTGGGAPAFISASTLPRQA